MKSMVIRNALLSLVLSAGCAEAQIAQLRPAKAEMLPLESRHHVTGDFSEFVDHEGRRGASAVRVMDDGTLRISLILEGFKKPCIRKKIADTFAPPLNYKDCAGSGAYVSKLVGGSIFPISVGSMETWEYTIATDRGVFTSGTRACETKAMVNITVPAGTFDAFHIVCDDTVAVYESFIDSRGVLLQFTSESKLRPQKPKLVRKLVKFTRGTN